MALLLLVFGAGCFQAGTLYRVGFIVLLSDVCKETPPTLAAG